jgi:hypothetical protein
MANIRVAVVEYQHHPMEISDNPSIGPTIGENIDRLLTEAIRESKMLQEVTVELSPEDWHKLASLKFKQDGYTGVVAEDGTRPNKHRGLRT